MSDIAFAPASTQNGVADTTSGERWNQPRGPVCHANGRVCIGRVGAPPSLEATGKQFHFWVPEDTLVEETQLVVCESRMAGRTHIYYGVITDVRRQSRKRNMGSEVNEADGDLAYEPPFKSEGFTYATVAVLRTEPPAITPPRERSEIFLATNADAQLAYQADEIDAGRTLTVGLVKNGGEALAGPGMIDMDYLLGVNGGHLNANGSAGRGTKSSYLLMCIYMLLREARRQEKDRPSDRNRLRIVPIVFNVKGYDLFYFDRWNRHYDPDKHAQDWKAAGVESPEPFTNVTFFAAQQPGNDQPVITGRQGGVQPFSWGLRDIIAGGLFGYLFAEADAQDSNFSALALDAETWLTHERRENDGNITRELRADCAVTTFAELLEWVQSQISADENSRALRNHHLGTWRKFYRRLMKMVLEGKGVLRRDDQRGHPLSVVRADTSDPIVVDLNALTGQPGLQRFVVATILRQLVDARAGEQGKSNLIYVVTLDELNRFAPRGATDPVTQLIETVAAEMRSQGIILFGAQQQASKVSDKVIENAAIRVLGRSGPLELNTPAWRMLSDSARIKAASLPLNEKLVIQDNFREPMHVRVPFPVWAMNPREAMPNVPNNTMQTGGEDDNADDISDLIQH